MVENSLVCKSVNFVVGIFNVIAIVPLVLTIGLVILALCAVDLTLFIACILGILKILIPSLPFNFDVDSIILKIIILGLIAIVGYYVYKFLRICIPVYVSFLDVYLVKSFTFKFKIM